MPIPVSLQVQPEASTPETRGSTKPMEAFLFDISELGIGLLSKNSLPWGTLVAIELSRSALPLADRSALKGLMRIRGRVIHAIPHAGQYRLGISFIRLEEGDLLLIQRLSSPQVLPDDRRRAPRIQLLEQTS